MIQNIHLCLLFIFSISHTFGQIEHRENLYLDYYGLSGPVQKVTQHAYQIQPSKKKSKKKIPVLDLSGLIARDCILIFNENGYLLSGYNRRIQYVPTYQMEMILEEYSKFEYNHANRLIHSYFSGDGHILGKHEDSTYYSILNNLVKRVTYVNDQLHSTDFYTYYDNDKLKSVQTNKGKNRYRLFTYVYDSTGYFTYDSLGHYTQITRFDVGKNKLYSTSYVPDQKLTQNWNYKYNELILLSSETYHEVYDDSSQKPRSYYQHQIPTEVNYKYDSNSHLIEIEKKDDRGLIIIRDLTFYLESGLISEIQKYKISSNGELILSEKTSYSYNEKNQLVKTDLYFYNFNNPIYRSTEFILDSYGNWILKNEFLNEELITYVEREIVYF
ncbi:MAG: hypothetical protein IPO32_11770 [Crocinitomicaceae bacterium]|nr:hypothetical protein [Crocinitomicaceae bacterium]